MTRDALITEMRGKPTSQLKERLVEIEKIVRPLQDEAGILRHELLERSSRFKVGDRIRWTEGRTSIGFVREIRPWVCGDPMWYVQRILKNGSLGAFCEVRHYNNPVKVE